LVRFETDRTFGRCCTAIAVAHGTEAEMFVGFSASA